MKNSHILLAGALVLSSATQGQHLYLSLHAEKTVAGNQYGGQVLFQTKHNWRLGAFYQASLLRTAEGRQISYPFWGASVSAPLAQCSKINFYLNLRCGLANKAFAGVAPGLETELKIYKGFSVSALMSVRMSYPSAMLRVNLQL